MCLQRVFYELELLFLVSIMFFFCTRCVCGTIKQLSLCSAARKRIHPPDTAASTLLGEALKKRPLINFS